MTTLSRHAIVSHSASAMYKLVADIESYPKFLPWCGGAKILSADTELVEASIDIDYKGVKKGFTTRNRLQHDKTMEMHLVDGPFKKLQGFWRFDPLDDNACKVSLDLEFEFSSRIVGMTIGRVFNEIAGKMVDSFCQRADEIYGK
ncbi:MAG: type II toxin-antitoxin system RatA family toxin [Acidiferrobacterales bacterium]|jgi:ribosome-associated toxin RatA of RatAB toxin-antitoxin module|nr:type II toxin-antitoxin system RatA family toxin [Acidiferrobacterales bacterium]